MTTYTENLKTSRDTIALAIAVAETGWQGCWDMAWHIAKQDPLLNADATQEAWTAWARRQIASRPRFADPPTPSARGLDL